METKRAALHKGVPRESSRNADEREGGSRGSGQRSGQRGSGEPSGGMLDQVGHEIKQSAAQLEQTEARSSRKEVKAVEKEVGQPLESHESNRKSLPSVRGTMQSISSDGDQEEVQEKSYPSPDAGMRKNDNDVPALGEQEVEGISRKVAKEMIKSRFGALKTAIQDDYDQKNEQIMEEVDKHQESLEEQAKKTGKIEVAIAPFNELKKFALGGSLVDGLSKHIMDSGLDKKVRELRKDFLQKAEFKNEMQKFLSKAEMDAVTKDLKNSVTNTKQKLYDIGANEKEVLN